MHKHGQHQPATTADVGLVNVWLVYGALSLPLYVALLEQSSL